jgi:trans-2,3-dihydro-3-hydroxyanthranilate isomerase
MAAELALPIYWVDAFTTQAFSGNAAAVVPDAVSLTVAQMQQLAREVNCSETAFLFPATHPQADLELRWFSPTQEIDFCGHATVAAMHVFSRLYPAQVAAKPLLSLQTRIGIVPVMIELAAQKSPQNTPDTAPDSAPDKYPENNPENNPETTAWVWLTVPPVSFQPIAAEVQHELAVSLGLAEIPLCPVRDSLNQDILVAVESLAQLHQLQPYLERLGALGQAQGWRGICVYSTETLEPDSSAHLRFFAPHCGIPEDPVTGSVSVPLVTHLQTLGKLAQAAQVTLEQGDCIGRPGRVRVDTRGSQPRFGGQAVTVIAGELFLPRQTV